MTKKYSIENGYYITYSGNPGSIVAFLAIRPTGTGKRKKIQKITKAVMKEEKQKFVIAYLPNGFSITFNKKQDEATVQSLLFEITRRFREEALEQTCMQSNVAGDLAVYEIGKKLMIAEDTAFRQHLDETNTSREKEIQPLLGILGSLLGIIIGMGAWLLVLSLGFISGWIGALIIVLGILGFKFLGKGITRGWAILSISFSVLAIIAVQFLSVGVWIYQAELEYYGFAPSLSEVFSYLPFVLKEGDVWGEIFIGLLLGLGFGSMVSWGFIKNIETKEERDTPLVYKKLS